MLNKNIFDKENGKIFSLISRFIMFIMLFFIIIGGVATSMGCYGTAFAFMIILIILWSVKAAYGFGNRQGSKYGQRG